LCFLVSRIPDNERSSMLSRAVFIKVSISGSLYVCSMTPCVLIQTLPNLGCYISSSRIWTSTHVRPNVYTHARCVEMLTLISGLCCVLFMNPIRVAAGDQRQTLVLCWAQLSRFHLKTETESSLRNLVF
jgi:hypothetical protein